MEDNNKNNNDNSILEMDEEVRKMFDLTKKKKKDKKSYKNDKDSKDIEKNSNDSPKNNENTYLSHPDGLPNYTYEDMLNRLNTLLGRDNNTDINIKRKSIEYPEVERLGTTKVVWNNFNLICKILNRPNEHLMKFFLTDLGTEGSLNESKSLILKGRFSSKQIEPILRKYIQKFVSCDNCHSLNTNIRKDKINSLSFIFCDDCHAHRSIQSIKAGYHAETRADRRAMRK